MTIQPIVTTYALCSFINVERKCILLELTSNRLLPLTKQMTEEQLDLLRHLIKQEIDAAQIDGMEHGAWGWADKQLEEGWQYFKDSFKSA